MENVYGPDRRKNIPLFPPKTELFFWYIALLFSRVLLYIFKNSQWKKKLTASRRYVGYWYRCVTHPLEYLFVFPKVRVLYFEKRLPGHYSWHLCVVIWYVVSQSIEIITLKRKKSCAEMSNRKYYFLQIPSKWLLS